MKRSEKVDSATILVIAGVFAGSFLFSSDARAMTQYLVLKPTSEYMPDIRFRSSNDYSTQLWRWNIDDIGLQIDGQHSAPVFETKGTYTAAVNSFGTAKYYSDILLRRFTNGKSEPQRVYINSFINLLNLL